MLKRYDIRRYKHHQGWAVIIIDTSIGYFSTVSDWGNYSYVWTHPGGEFRRFLMEVEDDYFINKILHGRDDRQVYDADATKKAIKDVLDEEEKSGDWPHLQEELEHFAESGLETKEDFYAWYQDTKLDDAHELIRMQWNPQAVSFARYILPIFKGMLREDIVRERCAAAESHGHRCELYAGHEEENLHHSASRALTQHLWQAGVRDPKEFDMGGAAPIQAPVGLWYMVETECPKAVPIAGGTNWEVTVPDGGRTRIVAQVESKELADLLVNAMKAKA